MTENEQEKELDITEDFLRVRAPIPRDFSLHPFPNTRFQGSKSKIISWIYDKLNGLNFESALDLFGGTGSVAHLFKTMGKKVSYNDSLKFNYTIGKALIENPGIRLEREDIDYVLTKHKEIDYPTFIQDTFKDIFYLEEENKWLDYVITNIRDVQNEYKQAMSFFALFQACIMKRPYNLFHRANLYVRTSDVERGFGNKTTWDTPFEEHFINVVLEANNAVFDNGKKCTSYNYLAEEFPEELSYDLVYMDPPYVSAKGVGVDYLDFYHFLEGMVDYNIWATRVLNKYKHLPLKGRGTNPWTKAKQNYQMFEKVFKKFKDSTIVVSYRNDGTPTIEQLEELLSSYKEKVISHKISHKYALSKNGESHEVLLIGT